MDHSQDEQTEVCDLHTIYEYYILLEARYNVQWFGFNILQLKSRFTV